jgi:hypothetical protein
MTCVAGAGVRANKAQFVAQSTRVSQDAVVRLARFWVSGQPGEAFFFAPLPIEVTLAL